MKSLKLLIPMIAFSMSVDAQGWVAPSPSVLHPVNSTLGLSPLRVGIGLNTPSEQLHTNQGVRFEGLTNNLQPNRVVTQDLTGKLYWTDFSSFGSGNYWSLFGNASTTPGTGAGQNYMGTSDNKRVVFATNTIERMTILNGSGNVGLGGSNPQERLHIQNGNALLDNVIDTTSGNLFFGSANINNEHLRLYYEPGTSPTFAGGVISVNTPDSTHGLIFRVDNINGATNRMKINGLGHVGINTDLPSAKLHVNCTNLLSPSDIRFENIPEGSGRVLVIDNAGHVFRSRHTSALEVPNPILESRVEELENEIKELKTLINNKGNLSASITEQGGFLSQNAPNPFSSSTTIKYELPKKAQKAVIGVYDMNGREIKIIQLPSENAGSVTINGGELQPGMYLYSLIVDGKYFDSKKMILTSQ